MRNIKRVWLSCITHMSKAGSFNFYLHCQLWVCTVITSKFAKELWEYVDKAEFPSTMKTAVSSCTFQLKYCLCSCCPSLILISVSVKESFHWCWRTEDTPNRCWTSSCWLFVYHVTSVFLWVSWIRGMCGFLQLSVEHQFQLYCIVLRTSQDCELYVKSVIYRFEISPVKVPLCLCSVFFWFCVCVCMNGSYYKRPYNRTFSFSACLVHFHPFHFFSPHYQTDDR